MLERLTDVIFFSIPLVSSIGLSLLLTYWFYKDRNKRKLLFSIGIFVSAFGYFNLLVKSLGVTPLFASADWLFVPISFAVTIAALSSLFKVKNFGTPLRIFLFVTVASIIVFFTQLPLGSLHLVLMTTFLVVAIPTLIYLCIKNRDISNVIFLLATFCFIFQGITINAGSPLEIPVFLSLFSMVLTGLMFVVPTNGDSFSMVAYLTLEQKLDMANKDLQMAQMKLLKTERLAAIGELAGMIGHDLRNPLQGIAGAAYYLKARSSSKLDDKGRVMVETIETCIERSNKIINDLLEYSKEIRLDVEGANPKSIVESTLSQIQVPSTIEIDDQTCDEPNLRIDKGKIERVFVNIVRNAFDSMPEGGKLTIKSENTDGTVAFSFHDTGTGMTDEVMSKLWTPLFTTKAKGMGFGLAICKRIVEAHGGEIKAETELGKGSVFTIIFPLETKPTLMGQNVFLNTPELIEITNAMIKASKPHYG
jgi:signal transduction histidine kinase